MLQANRASRGEFADGTCLLGPFGIDTLRGSCERSAYLVAEAPRRSGLVPRRRAAPLDDGWHDAPQGWNKRRLRPASRAGPALLPCQGLGLLVSRRFRPPGCGVGPICRLQQCARWVSGSGEFRTSVRMGPGLGHACWLAAMFPGFPHGRWLVSRRGFPSSDGCNLIRLSSAGPD